ncbi:RE1-silencing transcription factor [Bagarius yarrelli]|uniref:RE1-silencing transcription factor n=1 Tax=Bagarius yarrelli TaxID=175774 RepID=A0A556TVH9_BAGYA|nr:RE1-silencing transcription factor [Bagarius yarrelli]
MASQTVFNLCTDVFASSGGASLHEGPEVNVISGTELPVPQLVMLANVALNSEPPPEEEKQMAELKNVGCCSYSDSEDENVVHYSYDETAETMDEATGIEENSVEKGAVERTVETAPTDLSKKAPRGEASPKPKSGSIPEPNSATKPTKKRKKKPFYCKPCHFQAECEEEFVQHIRVHSAKKLIAEKSGSGVSDEESNPPQQKSSENCTKGVICCERCGYNTNRYDHYVAHLRHHKNEGDEQRVFRCTICPYSTVSQYHWKKHLRNHFPSKLFTCNQCSYFSDRKNNYIQHIRTHTGERPFQCVYCDYSSSQKTHLTRHLRTHSGERPFKCDSCSYLAANQHEVTRHARQVHNGPKPLSCPFCQYKTADRSNFKKHVELHVNPRQFLCPVCKYAASKKCNLQYHIKSRHPGCSDISMDVSKVRLRVKKADGEELKSAAEPRTRDRRKAELSEDVESSAGPINLSIKKSGKMNLDSEGAKKSASEPLKEKTSEKRAEKRASARNEGKETSNKKLRVKENVLCAEKQDAKKEKEVKKADKVAKSAEKVSKGRAKKEEKAAKEKKEMLTKHQDVSDVEKRTDLEKRQEKQKMEKETRAKEPKQKEQEEKTERKRQDDGIIERAKKDKEHKQREEEEHKRTNERQEKERIEQEMRENVRMEKREKERVEKEIKEREKKKEDERKEREKLERENKLKEEERRRRESERVEKEKREKELKQREEEEWAEKERLEKESNLQKNYGKKRDLENVKGSKKVPAKKATRKQNCDVVESQTHEEAKPKKTKRKIAETAPSPRTKKAKHSKVANSPQTSMSAPEQVKESKANGRQGRKSNMAAVSVQVPSTLIGTDEVAKALQRSPEPEKMQSSTAKGQLSTEKLSPTSEDLNTTTNLPEKPCLEVTGVKPTAAQTSADVDSGTDSPTLDLSKPPCSKPQEGEDDEGIHSHDGGSDISDCASEVSYDSGLNGKLPETPTEELPSPTQLLSHTCVFCDRTFPLEMDYRRHLNRHLVNVYYLDAATQGNKQT